MATPCSTPAAADSGALTCLTRRRCPRCSHVECTAVCSACGEFKFSRSVPAEPATAALDVEITEREAARLALRFALARWDARQARRAA